MFNGFGELYNESLSIIDNEFTFKNMNELKDGWQYYKGEFKNGLKDGMGTLYLTNGDKVSGFFSNNMLNGPSTI